MQFDLERASDLLSTEEGQFFAENINNLAQQLTEILNIYESATKQIVTKLEILDSEFQARNKRNPIHQIQRRVKSTTSIIEKILRKGFELDLDSIRGNLNDIAGIRVICSYIDDIYTVYEMLSRQSDLEVIKIVDYIKNPKSNGYRSLHIVLKVPVFFSDRVEKVKVEVQIRTIAMDFWASLEHSLRYKADGYIPPDISNELKDCADIISMTDLRMQNIHNQVECMNC
ncbi:MAG TPA: GTP pyrophosphokinase family protein [Oscillospiraceae bacterium]|nr:GTP pyrophosphokinase family protein [Oscillospiraceae bacterium]